MPTPLGRHCRLEFKSFRCPIWSVEWICGHNGVWDQSYVVRYAPAWWAATAHLGPGMDVRAAEESMALEAVSHERVAPFRLTQLRDVGFFRDGSWRNIDVFAGWEGATPRLCCRSAGTDPTSVCQCFRRIMLLGWCTGFCRANQRQILKPPSRGHSFRLACTRLSRHWNL